jgi:hypothetical protein
MADIDNAVVALESWINRLERRYVELAAEAARADASPDAAPGDGPDSDRRAELDRVAADMARARMAIELWRKQMG